MADRLDRLFASFSRPEEGERHPYTHIPQGLPGNRPAREGEVMRYRHLDLVVLEGRDADDAFARLTQYIDDAPDKASAGVRSIIAHDDVSPSQVNGITPAGTFNLFNKSIILYRGDDFDGLNRKTLYHEFSHSLHPQGWLDRSDPERLEFARQWRAISLHDQALQLDSPNEFWYPNSPAGPLSTRGSSFRVSEYSDSFNQKRNRISSDLEDFCDTGALHLLDRIEDGFELERRGYKRVNGRMEAQGGLPVRMRLAELFPTRAGFFSSLYSSELNALELARQASPAEFVQVAERELNALPVPFASTTELDFDFPPADGRPKLSSLEESAAPSRPSPTTEPEHSL